MIISRALLLIYILLVSGYVITLNSQVYFSNRYDFNLGNDWGGTVIPYEGYLYIQANALCELNTRICNGVIILDMDGNLIDKIIFYDTLDYNSPDAITIRNDTIYANVDYIGVEGKQYTILMYNIAGEYLGRHDYWDNGVVEHEQHWARGIKSNTDHLFVNFTYRNKENNRPVEAVRVYDREWNIVWEKVFPDIPKSLIRCATEPLNDGGVAVIYSMFNSGISTFAKVERLSAQGESLWEIQLPFNSFSRGRWVRLANQQDSDIVGIWEVDSFQIYIAYRPAMIFNISEDGDLKWSSIDWFTQHHLWDIHRLASGDIIACGLGENFYNDTIDEPEFRTGYLVKYSALGEKLWERRIFDHTDGALRGEFLNVTETPNHDIVVTGVLYDTIYGTPEDPTPDNIWVVKLDSNGCLIPACEDDQHILSAVHEPVAGTRMELIYPNPVHGELYLREEARRKYRIIDIGGIICQEGMTEGVIDVSNLNSGIYFIQIYDKKKALTQARFVKI